LNVRQARMALNTRNAGAASTAVIAGCYVRPRWSSWLHIRSIHCERSTVAFKPFANADAGGWRHIVQRNRANIRMRRSRDLPSWNAVVYNRAPARNNAGRRDRMIENSRRMVARQNVSSQIAFQEMVRADKSKMIRIQPKGKIVPRRMTVDCKADTGNKS
jgi:hypothetical protein